MQRFNELATKCRKPVPELPPWDLEEMLEKDEPPLLVDLREPYEYAAARIPGSLNVPQGVLELACEFGFEETVPALANGRNRKVVLICRSGNRSLLAGHTLQQLGFWDVASLDTGVRGWGDYELPLVDDSGRVLDLDELDELFTSHLRPAQMIQAA